MLTTSLEGWPHVALLSAGELVSAGPGRVRAALWTGSQTTANLTAGGRATLVVVHAGAAHYLRCQARRGPDLVLGDGSRLASFELDLVGARVDVADYAALTSGITFELHEPETVLARWRETIAQLRLLSIG